MSVDLGRIVPVRRPRVPGGRWLLGAVLLLATTGTFWACGLFEEVEQRFGAGGGGFGVALFFSALIAYIVPVYGYISERTVAALEHLGPSLDADDDVQRQWRRRISRKPGRWLAVVLAIGLTSGLAHNLLIYGSPARMVELGLRTPPDVAILGGTLMTWLVVTFVISGLLDNAFTLARAGRCCRVDLLDPLKLRPFANVAVISTLAIIGAQALFPLMTLEGRQGPEAYVPGLLALGGPMLLLAALPVWPVHQRIAAVRRAALARVNARIAELPAPDPERSDTLTALAPLLTYRRELTELSEWPLDVGVVARLGLYLIIPPLTWVGAALIERLVEVVL